MLRLARSSIDDLFNYDITNRMTCPNCGEPSCAVESGPLLHVHFEDGARLEDILRDITFSPDIVENRNCDKCDTHVDTPNIHRLATGPPLLVMSLDRFTYTPQSGSKKNTASVPFAEELDLTPYTDNNFPLKYRLLSVIQHRGSTLGGGHFITIAKDRFEDWVALDDEEGEPFLAVGTDPFCPRKKNVQTDFMPYLLFWSRVDDAVVAAETPMNDASASTNDGTNGKASTDNDNHEDDEMQPLQISINGILQPPSRKYFVKKSALAGLKQRHIEGVYASTDSTLSELEARGREKEAKKKKKAENKKKEKAAEEVKKEKNKKTGKTSKKGIGKKRKEKTKTKTKTELKKPTTSSQKDTEKTAEKTQKAQKKEGKGEITTKKGKAEEGEEEEEKKPVSKKRKSPDPNSTSQQESKSVSKKQKSSNGNTSNSSQEKKNPGDSKKKK